MTIQTPATATFDRKAFTAALTAMPDETVVEIAKTLAPEHPEVAGCFKLAGFGDAPKPGPAKAQPREKSAAPTDGEVASVHTAMRERGYYGAQRATATLLSEATRYPLAVVSACLQKLRRAGDVTCEGRGKGAGWWLLVKANGAAEATA